MVVCRNLNDSAAEVLFYGIRYVPIKMNVIFQETYENIN